MHTLTTLQLVAGAVAMMLAGAFAAVIAISIIRLKPHPDTVRLDALQKSGLGLEVRYAMPPTGYNWQLMDHTGLYLSNRHSNVRDTIDEIHQ